VEGLAQAAAVPGASVLHAGTAVDGQGRIVTSGGRVLSVVGTGPDLRAARAVAYEALDLLQIRGSHHRRDIADPARMTGRP
jgi:phosphoribosylamine--glycine ligase